MKTNEENNKSLIVNEGINQPESININAINNFKKKKKKIFPLEYYVEGIICGNITILSQAITIVESTLAEHQEIAQKIIEKCLPHSEKSIRIGITGVPGAGKSTFIEAIGQHITKQGHKLAVLAIDPSSERSGGSILGDKTRMEALSIDKNAFIRPSPTCGTLGGVARKTREIIILCEAAGFDVIFVETVGVGQSETIVHSMVDFFLLLMLAGAGDELQGIKRGIMEMADAIIITKADGNNIDKANLAKAEYQNALHLFPAKISEWYPKILTTSSKEYYGIDETWDLIINYFKFIKKNNYFFKNRNNQARFWMNETINQSLIEHFKKIISKNSLFEIENSVIKGEISSFAGAKILIEKYFNSLKRND